MKNRKNIVAFLLVAIIGIVGLTVAYFSNSTSIENEFESSEYGTDVTETFTSPTGWQPGDETPKVLTVKNTGEVDEAVRVKIEEKWVNKNGEELPLTQDGNVAALIHYINSSDWTKVEVANEDYYYYYYNYKLAPTEETSELLDKVTFNPLIGASTTCTDSIGTNGETIRSCTSNGSGYDGATYTLKFTIETVQYNKYQEAWNTDVVIKEEKPHPGTLTLLEKTNPVSITNYTDGDIHEMYTFEHGATDQTPALTDYRYIGDDPYNYVYFNCDSLDNQNTETCEVWRIIGVFDVEREVDDEENPGEKKTITETRMKLVRGTSLSNYRKWDNRNSEQYSSGNYGKNDWNGSLMQTFLIGDYYNRIGEATTDGLKESTKTLMDNARYYLGSISSFETAESIFNSERGIRVYNNTRPTSWDGEVALMYPSDMFMTYAKGVNDKCYNSPDDCSNGIPSSSWVYMSNGKENSHAGYIWFVSPYTSSLRVVSFQSYGDISSDLAYYSLGVRPVVYLSSDVQIFDGDGSSTNPYKLKKPQ